MKQIRTAATLLAAAAVLLSSTAMASPKGDLKDQARKLAKELRADGWPQSRCALEATFINGHIFASSGSLQYGDKLLFITDKDVSQSADDDIVEVLKNIPANAKIPLRVERDGEATDVEVQCVDSAVDQQILLDGLDLAGRKKVEECATTLAPIGAHHPAAAAYRFQCAVLAKDASGTKLSTIAYDSTKMGVWSASFSPELRLNAVRFLRAQRLLLPEQQMQELIQITTTWEGDEDIWEASEPDWYRYRLNAERAVLGGFYDPESAIIEWPHGFRYGTWKPFLQGRIEGYWSCGRVNAKNRLGGYVGSRYFVVVMGHQAEVLFREVGTGDAYDVVSGACQQSVGQLPPPPAAYYDDGEPEPVPQIAAPAATSMADELKKLADLFEAGALTQEEYDVAKAKVINGT